VRASLIAFACVALPAAVAVAEPPDWLLGEWILSTEKSHALQPEKSGGGGGGGGFGTPTISVGGVFIPLPGGGSAPGAGGARDPRVLRCDAMTVTMQGENVHFSYHGSGEETMKPGNDQGRKTSWRNKRLKQTYTTTSRSVTKTYAVDDEGDLIVTVRIKPKGAKSATYVRVFERPQPGH